MKRHSTRRPMRYAWYFLVANTGIELSTIAELGRHLTDADEPPALTEAIDAAIVTAYREGHVDAEDSTIHLLIVPDPITLEPPHFTEFSGGYMDALRERAKTLPASSQPEPRS